MSKVGRQSFSNNLSYYMSCVAVIPSASSVGTRCRVSIPAHTRARANVLLHDSEQIFKIFMSMHTALSF